jgi:sporulation protein YlmC with PRC-barrel domain
MSDYELSPASTQRFIESDRIEGTAVYDARGHHVGQVKRLIIEKVSGQVAFVIIAFQSFFGLGESDHALAWNKLHYDVDLGGYRTEVTEEELRSAPDFSVRTDEDYTDDPTIAFHHPGAQFRPACAQPPAWVWGRRWPPPLG